MWIITQPRSLTQLFQQQQIKNLARRGFTIAEASTTNLRYPLSVFFFILISSPGPCTKSGVDFTDSGQGDSTITMEQNNLVLTEARGHRRSCIALRLGIDSSHWQTQAPLQD